MQNVENLFRNKISKDNFNKLAKDLLNKYTDDELCVKILLDIAKKLTDCEGAFKKLNEKTPLQHSSKRDVAFSMFF